MSASKKVVNKLTKSKTTKKKFISRPSNKKSTTKKSSKKTTVKTKPKTKPVSKPKKKLVKTKNNLKKSSMVKLKKIKAVPKPDTLLSCHRCGQEANVNFEHVWTNGWPVCCREGMHIEDSSIKIGEVMNKAWIEAGGYGGSLNLQV